jgi:predicted nuclease of restriction endonuclease-like RecB superfamily
MKAYLEVVGFWTEEYLARKVQKLKEVHASNMVVAVDKTLGCSRFKGLTMEVIFYERDVPVKPIIDYLRATWFSWNSWRRSFRRRTKLLDVGFSQRR